MVGYTAPTLDVFAAPALANGNAADSLVVVSKQCSEQERILERFHESCVEVYSFLRALARQERDFRGKVDTVFLQLKARKKLVAAK